MKKLGSVKFIFVGLLALIMAAVCLCPLSAGSAQALSYGGVDISSLWYYGEAGLQIDGAKTVVDSWNKNKLSKKIIAVIDTGIDYRHEVFDGVLYTDSNGTPTGYDARTKQTVALANMNDDSTDKAKHGNAIAGVIAIMIKELGLQDYIKIYPIKANKTEKGKENSFDIVPVIEGIYQANRIGADAINMSLGASNSKSDWAVNEQLIYALESVSAEVFITAAAGNDANDSDKNAVDSQFYPAVHDGVFGVMAYGKNGLYSKSNYGSAYDIAAPGENVYTAKYPSGDLYDEWDGTSLASPIVAFAGVLAKLRYEAEGRTAPKGFELSRLMRNLDCRTLKKGSTDIRCLDFKTVVTQNFDETEFVYDAPTDIVISHNGEYGKKDGDVDYTKTVYQRANATSEITFLAKINPYGDTDPALESAVQWIVKRADDTEEVLGSGLKFDYTPTYIDETVTVIARLNYGESIFEQQQAVFLSSVAFLVGDVRVTYAKYADAGVDKAPSKGVVYTGVTTVFSLTGIEYIGNKRDKITWYVDGKLAGEGAIFNYSPKTTGKHIISARYDGSPIPREFVANVQPFIARPLDLTMLILGLLLIVAAVSTGVVIYTKRKKAKQTECEHDE